MLLAILHACVVVQVHQGSCVGGGRGGVVHGALKASTPSVVGMVGPSLKIGPATGVLGCTGTDAGVGTCTRGTPTIPSLPLLSGQPRRLLHNADARTHTHTHTHAQTHMQEVAAFAALSLGLVFTSSCKEDIVMAILQVRVLAYMHACMCVFAWVLCGCAHACMRARARADPCTPSLPRK